MADETALIDQLLTDNRLKVAPATFAAELNERPRETLGWMTPSEKLSKLVATAA